MQIIILAGGVGKRIAPLGTSKPKSMFQIMGKPLLHHVLDMVKESKIEIHDVIIVVGPDDKLIKDYLGNGEKVGLNIKYALQENPLGQADALLSARKYVKESFLAMNANDIYDSSLISELAKLGQQNSMDVALVGRQVKNPSKFGVMDFNSKGKLIRVVEKPEKAPSDFAVIGLYYLSPKIWESLDNTPKGQHDDQYELAYQKLINPDGDKFISYDGPFESYKYPWDLLELNDLLLKTKTNRQISKTAQIASSAIVEGDVVIEDNVRVMEYAIIRGPAYIGIGSIIGNHTLLRGGVSIGKDCVIGHSTEVSHSIMGDGCWTHKNFIGDSIISDNCSFGAGTITANVRFDERSVKVKVADQRISSDMDHFGIIMAEDCRTGCNSVLSPGVKIGPNSIVGPGLVLTTDLLPGKMARLNDDAYKIFENTIDVHNLSREERKNMLERIKAKNESAIG